MPYDLNFDLEKDLKFHVKKFFLRPESWGDPTNQIPFALKWHSVEFDMANQGNVPIGKGVYAFTVKPAYANLFDTNYLFYIGKTNAGLRTRFGQYVDDGLGKSKPRMKVYQMLKMYKGHLNFYYAVLPNNANVNLAEDLLINTFMPHVNVRAAIAKIKPEYQYLYE